MMTEMRSDFQWRITSQRQGLCATGGEKNSVREKFCCEKFCPNPYFAWEILLSRPAGSEKNIYLTGAKRRIFFCVLPVIEAFVQVNFNHP